MDPYFLTQLSCPLCRGALHLQKGSADCRACGQAFPQVAAGGASPIYDFRAAGIASEVQVTFSIPQQPLATGEVEPFGRATEADFACPSREEIRARFGTKLAKESLYYIDRLRRERGVQAPILDLGCGNGGNQRYLRSIGFEQVLSVDYDSPAAECLLDVHRLPFADEGFDLILTTATLEHFYNPFLAMMEMSRVLRPGGMLIATASFWESWHSNSCFHFTPGGLDLLCRQAGLELHDLWSGWGFIPAVASHALCLAGSKRLTYALQRGFDALVGAVRGPASAKRLTFRTSGAFGLMAIKGGTRSVPASQECVK